MSDEWEVYFTSMDDAPASILVDVGQIEATPDSARPFVGWVRVKLQEPDEDGMATEAESETLLQVEDDLNDAFTKHACGPAVGRITSSGRRDFCFYGPTEAALQQAAVEAMARHPEYAFACDVAADADWDHYCQVLYPTPADWQCIRNRYVVEQLAEAGDHLTEPRTVTHWAYFTTQDGRGAYAQSVRDHGFAVVSESLSEDPEAEYPFALEFERTDPVDWATINEITVDLAELAESHEGDYDGWETMVVSGDEGDAEVDE